MSPSDSHDCALRDVGGFAIRLVDDVYAAWDRAQAECHNALRAWLESGSRNHFAYYVYRAALDREEAAAGDLEQLFRLVAA
jgi:hypothetical protein